MSHFADCLNRREAFFSAVIPISQDTGNWIENELLNAPNALTSVKGISFQSSTISGQNKRVSVTVSYILSNGNPLVFSAKDFFELVTAVSVALKMHLQNMTIVIDNRTSFISSNGITNCINACKEYVGEELEIHQYGSSKSSWRSFFNNRIIIYNLETQYFDSSKDINDLSCILAEQAIDIRRKTLGRKKEMINEIMKWFRQNIEYKKTNRTEDHSAVGLYKNKTAVCQGIAAYAYQLLSFCGFEARYVSGEGNGSRGWGPHGWNMVLLEGKWLHIDYTFELNSRSRSPVKSEPVFRRDHRWNERRYNVARSNEIMNARKTLRQSIVVIVPNTSCFSINGCIVDMSALHRMSIVTNNHILLSILDVVTVYGGCYTLLYNEFRIYIGTNSYTIPFNQMIFQDGTWYVDATWMKKIKIDLKIDQNTIVLQNHN